MRLKNFRGRSKPLERDKRLSAEGAREFQNKEQTARKRAREYQQKGANCSKGTKEFQNKEQTARKRLEKLKTRSKPLERDQRT